MKKETVKNTTQDLGKVRIFQIVCVLKGRQKTSQCTNLPFTKCRGGGVVTVLSNPNVQSLVRAIRSYKKSPRKEREEKAAIARAPPPIQVYSQQVNLKAQVPAWRPQLIQVYSQVNNKAQLPAWQPAKAPSRIQVSFKVQVLAWHPAKATPLIPFYCQGNLTAQAPAWHPVKAPPYIQVYSQANLIAQVIAWRPTKVILLIQVNLNAQ